MHMLLPHNSNAGAVSRSAIVQKLRALLQGNRVLYVNADAASCLAGEVVPWCYGRFQQAQELLTYQWVASTSEFLVMLCFAHASDFGSRMNASTNTTCSMKYCA
jgi:hypothetical protein